MSGTAELQLEKAELYAVLQSGIFQRAPNLYNFLKYVGECYLSGAADQIKEYNIAVEALGRSPDFDQRKDSIVRVEAHRLRKRLAEYYAGPGAENVVKIFITSGQYAPRFVHEALPEPAFELPVPSQSEITPPAELVRVGFRPRTALVVSACMLASLICTVLLSHAHPHAVGASLPSEIWHGSYTQPVSSEFRMLSGYSGEVFLDRQGHRWQADSYFTGGRSIALSANKTIEGLPDPILLHGFREGNFHYDIPLRAGVYELHLYFSETRFDKANPSEGDDVRSFRMDINGENRLDLFEPLSEAGAPDRLQVRVFKDVIAAKDGRLHLQFSQQSGQPFLNALEILPSTPGRIRPIRIVARKTPVTDAEGRVWAGDEYAIGGHLTERNASVSNTADKVLFEGERFGNFAYHLPVAPGKYRVTLHFAETYFGSRIVNAPPFDRGVRLFNVEANGVALLRDFDLGMEAGGPNRGIQRMFDNIEPNGQGLIVLEFHPNRNYACINAIEVEEME